jgi:hypothetical protein
MLFCQLGRAHRLREICGGLASCLGKLSHLGIARVPVRSTLAYANEHRLAGLHRDLFFCLLERCRLAAADHKFRFKNKLLSLDAMVIDLCAPIFDWAKFRRTKGDLWAWLNQPFGTPPEPGVDPQQAKKITWGGQVQEKLLHLNPNEY